MIVFYIVFITVIYRRTSKNYKHIYSELDAGSAICFMLAQVYIGPVLIMSIYLTIFDPAVQYKAPNLPPVLTFLLGFVIVTVVNIPMMIILIFGYRVENKGILQYKYKIVPPEALIVE